MSILNEPIPTGAVIVGVDGSKHSRRALDTAGEVATRQRRPLHLLHCYEPYPSAMGPVLPSADVTTTLRSLAEEVVRDARAQVADSRPDLTVTCSLSTHDAREKLTAISHLGSLLVVGSRGLGAMRSLLLGSVSLWVSHHSACPVLVVRPEPGSTEAGITVGSDASSRSLAAIEFAFAQASEQQAPLTVVHCVPPSPFSEGDEVPLDEDRDDLPRHRLGLAESIAGLREKYVDVAVDLVLERGPAATYLVEASRRSRMLVVGAHRRSAWDLLGGSVSRTVIEHAHCPVAVVPEVTGPAPGA
jgi:nucleotide-binding universal stress UspA family protein